MSEMSTWESNVNAYPRIKACRDMKRSGWDFGRIGADILAKADLYLLTDRQAAVLEASVDRHEKTLERQRQAAELQAAGVRCPEGRQDVRGHVVSLKWHTSQYGRRTSTVQKMVVRTAAGWAVWATVPAGLPEHDVTVGAEVEFQATLEPSDRDPLFGFAKRPTRAKIFPSERNTA
jgi:hypothetical protein